MGRDNTGYPRLTRGRGQLATAYWHPLDCRSDCLIKTIRSEGYFGMYRGKAWGRVTDGSGWEQGRGACLGLVCKYRCVMWCWEHLGTMGASGSPSGWGTGCLRG